MQTTIKKQLHNSTYWKAKTTQAINASKRSTKESRFINRFSLWALIWIGGFIVEPLVSKLGFPYYSSTVGYSVIFIRDIALAAVAYVLWKKNFRNNSAFSRAASRQTEIVGMSKAKLIFLTIAATVVYFVILIQNNISIPFFTLPKLLLAAYPLRILAFVFYQQMINTLFLMDTCVERIGFRDGLFFTSFMFGFSHFGCMAVNVVPEMTLVLSIVSGIAMYFWGTMRKRYNTLFYSITTHYVFWIALQVITTGMWVWR